MWIEAATTAMLLLTTVFSYLHEQYIAAVVAGICAGLTGGMAITRALYRRRERW